MTPRDAQLHEEQKSFALKKKNNKKIISILEKRKEKIKINFRVEGN